MSYQDKLDWSTWVALYYPQATEINAPSATTTYNCHSYAWNKSEGGPTCAVAYYADATNESIYWTDYSYIETTEPYTSKISYTSDDHSAIQTSTQGAYISKWGDLPLMRHARDYGIYNMRTPSGEVATTSGFNVWVGKPLLYSVTGPNEDYSNTKNYCTSGNA
jgi:hypothetical protein